MPRPEALLEPGERLLFCGPVQQVPLWVAVVVSGLGLLYFAALVIALEYLEYPWRLVIGLGAIVLYIMGPEIFMTAAWSRRWHIVVTNRRIILRRGVFVWRRDVIELSRLGDIRHDWRRGRLTLEAGGHRHTIRCDERTAAKMLEALVQARNEPA
jgi:membrane protein YdbS with pleckstrin-like domain